MHQLTEVLSVLLLTHKRSQKTQANKYYYENKKSNEKLNISISIKDQYNY